MKGLYKGKYIIAIYDENDSLIDVGCLPGQLTHYKNRNVVEPILSKLINGKKPNSRVFLIDVTEKHDDIFAEEDKLFLDFVNNTRKKTVTEQAKELGICERTFYRRMKIKK